MESQWALFETRKDRSTTYVKMKEKERDEILPPYPLNDCANFFLEGAKFLRGLEVWGCHAKGSKIQKQFFVFLVSMAYTIVEFIRGRYFKVFRNSYD